MTPNKVDSNEYLLIFSNTDFDKWECLSIFFQLVAIGWEEKVLNIY